MKNFKAMLAHKATDHKIDWENETVFQQPKLDGVRCLFTKDGAFSRSGKQFLNVQHLEQELAPYFNENPDLILDGELYNHKLKNDFEKIISLVRKKYPTDTDRAEAAELVQFHNYDIFDSNAPSLLYTERATIINTYHNLFRPQMVETVTTLQVTKMRDVESVDDQFLAAGYEGSMLRLNWPYEQKRSKSLKKVKKFHDEEAIVIGFVEGKGKLKGKVGKFICKDANGLEFGCPPSGMTFPQRAQAWIDRESYIGKTITYVYFEKTKRGAPRFPVFKCIRNYE